MRYFKRIRFRRLGLVSPNTTYPNIPNTTYYDRILTYTFSSLSFLLIKVRYVRDRGGFSRFEEAMLVF